MANAAQRRISQSSNTATTSLPAPERCEKSDAPGRLIACADNISVEPNFIGLVSGELRRRLRSRSEYHSPRWPRSRQSCGLLWFNDRQTPVAVGKKLGATHDDWPLFPDK